MSTKKRKSENGKPAAVAEAAASTSSSAATTDKKTDNSNAPAAAGAAGEKKPDWRIVGSPCHIEIPAHDLQRISKFFTEAFGWKCTPWGAEYMMWSSDGLSGGFFKTAEPIANGLAAKTTSFAIFSKDIPAALAKVDSLGGTVTRCNTVIAPGMGAWAQFQDTEGNPHSVFSERTDDVVVVGDSIEQKVLLDMTAHDAYETFMDEKKHGAIAPSKAGQPPCKVERTVNGAFSISGGYITGRTIFCEPDRKLVQSWRAVDWPAGHWSTATFTFEANATDARQSYVTLSHAGVPADKLDGIEKGWFEFYWRHMKLAKDLTQKRPTSGWVYRVGTEEQYKACEKLGKIMPCDEELKSGAFHLFTANQVKGVLKRHFVGSKDAVAFRVCTTEAGKVGTLKWELNKNPDPSQPELSPVYRAKDGSKDCAVPWSAVDAMIRLPWDQTTKAHIFPADFA